MLNAPIRTIQRDYAHLKNRQYEQLKAREEAVRERLKCFSDEEVVEAFLGSPERRKELWEKIQAHSGKK